MPSLDRIVITQRIRRRPRNDIAAFERRYPGAFSVSGRARIPCPPARPIPTTSDTSGMCGHDRRVPLPAHPTEGADHVQPWSREFTGRIDELQIESEALRGNALGDPNVRPLWVYVPPGYDDDPDRRFPCVYVIQGLTGQLDMWRNREAFRPSYLENIDALFASG